MKRRSTVAAIITSAMAIGSIATLPAASGAAVVSCLVPHDPPASVDRVEIEPNGPYTYQRWLVSDSAQEQVSALGDYLEASYRYGSPTDNWLSKGLIGVAIDHVNQEYVVVVDSATLTDTTALQESLLTAADSAADAVDDERLTVRVAESCHSADELLAAASVLAGRDWAPEAAKTPIGWSLDAHDSTFHVSIPDGPASDALKKELGDLVTIETASHSLWSRLNDFSPHYSAAGIHAGSENNNHCTSAVTVDLPNGNVGSVTAGHCFWYTGNGDLNGRNVKSGIYHYGETQGGSGYTNGYDMVRIGPDGDNFVNKIWTDPPAGDTRVTNSGGDPQVGALLCTDGAFTFAVCGAEVTSVTFTWCPEPAYACKKGIFRMQGRRRHRAAG
jgi:hypothetical protein